MSLNESSRTSKKHEIFAYILLILTAIIWGGTWPLGRWLVSEEVGGETIPPMMIVVIRYFLALTFNKTTAIWCLEVILQQNHCLARQ